MSDSEAYCDKEILRSWAEAAAVGVQHRSRSSATEPLQVSFRIWGPLLEKQFGKLSSFAYRWDDLDLISVVLIEDGYTDSDLVMLSS